MPKKYNSIYEAFADAYLKKDWESFCLYGSFPELMEEAFTHIKEIPDEYKYDFVLNCYSHVGNEIESVRKAVRALPKIKPAVLPEEIAEQEEITVYRAGTEQKRSAKKRISWTTSLGVALFFLCRNETRYSSELSLKPFLQNKPKCHIFKAKIKTKDIIAYLDDRYEKEILQYDSVFDVEDITSLYLFMSEEETLQQYLREKEAHNNAIIGK